MKIARFASSLAACISVLSGSSTLGATITLTAAADVTLYEDATGALANGGGESIFAGRTGFNNNTIRRGLLLFDVTPIPAGATITGASLQLTVLQANSGDEPMSLHRCSASWTEGTAGADSGGASEGGGFQANEGDATWIHRSATTLLWASAGGDFQSTPSASLTVGFPGVYNWSTPEMVADVQAWRANASGNHGWLIRGNEPSTGSAKRFGSRTNSDVLARPSLTITYTPPCFGDVNADGVINTADLTGLLAQFGTAVPVGTGGDLDGNGFVNTADLVGLLSVFGTSC